MITSFIQGGLGNQLFQIAAGISLATEVKTEFCLLSGQHHLPLQGSRIENYKSNILKNIKFVNSFSNQFVVYSEPSFSYCDLPKRDWTYLSGYFQSEKYFKNNSNIIKDVFAFDKLNIPKGSVSMHLRQGDYCKLSNIHPVLDFTYYKKALEVIGDYSKIYVLSDSEIPEKYSFKNCEFVNSKNDYLDFCIMANCDHNIIANSTFSWWAAYLNKNKFKKVVAPKNWFGPDGPKRWDDIYCDGWEVI